MSTGLYEILGLPKTATPAEIRKAYRNKARDTHPDRLPRGVSAEGVQTANERFRLVNNAYEILTNVVHRELYDLYGVWPPPAGASATTSSSSSSEPMQAHNGDGTKSQAKARRGFEFTDPFELFESSVVNDPSYEDRTWAFDEVFETRVNLPPLTEQDKMKFMQIFEGSGAQHGILDGHRSFELLQKSNLPMNTLKDIWDLADRDRRGYLDLPAFTVAMYLVQWRMSGKVTALPSSLPQRIYDEAAKNVSPSAAVPSDSTADDWKISPSDWAAYNHYFDSIEHEHQGYVKAEAAAIFFGQSGLSESVLAQIWDLADVDVDGRLTREEFAAAMCLTRGKLDGKEIPDQLPPSLLPARTLWS